MRQAFRASILHCLADPGATSLAAAYAYFDDGVLVVEDGVVVELGEAAALLPQVNNTSAMPRRMNETARIKSPSQRDTHNEPARTRSAAMERDDVCENMSGHGNVADPIAARPADTTCSAVRRRLLGWLV